MHESELLKRIVELEVQNLTLVEENQKLRKAIACKYFTLWCIPLSHSLKPIKMSHRRRFQAREITMNMASNMGLIAKPVSRQPNGL
jgi:hypothetical protein